MVNILTSKTATASSFDKKKTLTAKFKFEFCKPDATCDKKVILIGKPISILQKEPGYEHLDLKDMPIIKFG